MISIGEFFFGVISSVVATAVCAMAIFAYTKQKDRRPIGKVLNFTSKEKIVFVFPSRPDSPDHPGLLQNARVAFEDMLAINYVRRVLNLGGWHEDQFDMREDRHFRVHDPHDSAKNVVLLCSPRSNPITREFLDRINQAHRLNWDFRQSKDNPNEWDIKTDGGEWSSATFGQERSIRAAGGAVEDGPLDDVAVIAKATNPYNPLAKVLIVAGVRGIGTWGAARYLRDHIGEIEAKTSGRDFAMLLKVRYRQWEIEEVVPADVTKTF